ncbi:MAG: hypothetical protein HYU75_10335 [Betaproteobacteria bacterium]|nr:hypothetical protein [Betaproteobacteria bacterium]
MDATDVWALAHHLLETQGAKAIAEAAQKAASFEDAGDKEQSKTWRRVEAVLWEMRGPHES